MPKRTRTKKGLLNADNFALRKLTDVEYELMIMLYRAPTARGAFSLYTEYNNKAVSREELYGIKETPPSIVRIQEIMNNFVKMGIVCERKFDKTMRGHGHTVAVYYLPDEIMNKIKNERTHTGTLQDVKHEADFTVDRKKGRLIRPK